MLLGYFFKPSPITSITFEAFLSIFWNGNLQTATVAKHFRSIK